ncbi:MAG TPA: sugar phosphate nucleotidyltransferase [Candidatus Dormibacteraeota bacterium]|nr:sugar phosphate nucleotidyltransferase [Candidatus Dormibacteraeota bacterium]
MILAGGLGTRMRPVTERIPKALVSVLGRPFAELQLEWLAVQGVEEVVYSVGYRGEMLRDAVGDGERFGLRIVYVHEGEDLRGTGGALRLAADRGVLPEAFFLLYGDSYLTVDLAAVERTWTASGLPALMTVLRNNGRWDSSNAVLDGDLVRYDKRNPQALGAAPEWIDYGLSVLGAEAVCDWLPEGGRGDVADLFHQLGAAGLLAGFEASERFYEVGSPQGLADLEEQLRSAR